MTDEELKVGRLIRERVMEIYREHPEKRRFKKGMDRYDLFVAKMCEKYGTSTTKIIQELVR